MLKTKKILLLSLLIASINSFAVSFQPDTLYSRWIINSRMGDFRDQATTVKFKTATTTRTAGRCYVTGLVAKSIQKAYEQ